jgi:ribonuclease HII
MLRSACLPNVAEAGCDEAGRGCLAGPVFAAAVILPANYSQPLLNDSKKLSPAIRDRLRPEIERDALAWAVALVGHAEIDEINILRASIKAMHLALDKLALRPEHILVDGNRFTCYRNIPHQCVVKGDATYASIAAASVLAKTWRDAFMLRMHEDFPYYGWNHNKGYPTEEHRDAIRRYGISPLHRKSFSLLGNQLEFIF